MNKLHAKIYVGDQSAIIGSSNFSKSGIITQREANVRVESQYDSTETEQYRSIKQIAENYYQLADDYQEEILALLKRLLRDADWEEALARAIAEILESKWMKDYPALYQAIMSNELWPSQRIGIARAMKIIQDRGNVLIADPTGSGKTKFATALAYTLFHWLWENGLKDRSNALIISPKQVVENWQKEQQHFKLFNRIESMGKLSNSKAKTKQQLQKELDNADILVIDEAHNYLHPGSKRSKAITPKGSTHVILSTATPINKKAEDLLRLIELLDIDNLREEDLEEFLELRRNRFKKVDEGQFKKLKSYINHFIVRRTKKDLNRMIAHEPKKYVNIHGHQCRYPKTKSDIYPINETTGDREIAKRIKELTSQLKGIHYLQKLHFPYYVSTDEEKQNYLRQRLNSAPALAAFMIRASLRSSHCALMEYLHGSEEAMRIFEVESIKNPSGNIINTIRECKESKLPARKFPDAWLQPEHDWLLDETKYALACDREIEIYSEISKLIMELSGEREKSKASVLLQKVNEFGKVLAFDSTILTLDYLKKLLAAHTDVEVVVATGQSEKSKSIVKDSFGLGSEVRKKLIALCSDAMSEGINLPDAKALVLLDMPSVLRVIEQRIGRLERMDSEHEQIHIFWPNDSDEFSLKGDKRMVDILVLTENLIGNNVEIPEAIYQRYLKDSLTTENLIKAFDDYSNNEYEWEGVKDSTQYLYGLIEGRNALITEKIYNEFKDVDASVKTAISFIETDKTWSFFAFRGDSTRSPKWLLIDDKNKPYTDFDNICIKLREYLANAKIIQRRWKDVDTPGEIKNIIRKLRKQEEAILPPKKKRALKTGKRILEKLLENDSAKKNNDRMFKIKRLLDLFDLEPNSESMIDHDHFADLWLTILQPALDAKRKSQLRKRTIITLNNLTPKDVPLSDEKLEWIYENCQYASTLDEIVAACIIGINKGNAT